MTSMTRKILVRRCAFTLIELLVVIAIIALLISLLLPALGKYRLTARLLISQINMRELNTAGASYAADTQDKIASFTWTPSGRNSTEGDTENITGLHWTDNDLESCSAQATYIMRRRAGLAQFVNQPDSWIPHILYSHLVLLDYRGATLPTKTVVSPEDTNRLNWQRIEAFRSNEFAPIQPPYDPTDNWRWSFGSSYQAVPASFSPDQGEGTFRTTEQGGSYRGYNGPNQANVLGKRRWGDVAFTAQKVQWFDGVARHEKIKRYYGDASARVPLAFFDGSVSFRASKDSNVGFQPNRAITDSWTSISISQADIDASPWDRANVLVGSYKGRYQWTRGGLKGIDFGGSSIRTGNQGTVPDRD